MDMTSVFAEITKSTVQEDGSLLVYGKATGSDLDMDEQRCDQEWLSTAMPEWFRGAGGVGGNIREQHDAKRAVGKAVEHEITDDGSHLIRARVVDPVAKAKVEAGILTGFSIGIKSPRIAKSADAKNGLIVGGQIIEVSLVDRPCLPTATLTMCKAATPGWEGSPADLDEELGLVKCEELVESDEVEKSVDVNEVVEKVDEPDEQKSDDVATDDGLAAGVLWAAEIVKAASRDQVVELIKASGNTEAQANVLAGITVPATAPPPEMDDILHAKAAIAIIGQLIQAEAMNLATRPYEDCDILLLMEAVQALRMFICREKMQPGNENSDVAAAVASLSDSLNRSAEGDAEKAEVVEKAKYTAEELRTMLADGKAMKNADGDPSYPIGDVEDLENAIHAVGRGKGDHDAIRSYIKGRAKALGKSDLIPDSWSGSSKAADPELVEALTELADAVAEKAAEATKTVEPDAVKAVGAIDEDILLKALTGVFEKEDSPLGALLVKALMGAAGDDAPLKELIKSVAVESTTELVEASAKSAAEAVTEVTARLEKVEGMAIPGGPALRRTETERTNARRDDLVRRAAHFKALATGTHDRDLVKGYSATAAQIEAEIRGLAL